MKTKLYLLAMISVLVLAALACGSTSTPTEPPASDVLFQDDFSDDSSGWDQVNVDEGLTDYTNGVYRIWVNTTSTDVWANPGLNFTDTIVEVEATKVGGPDDNDFGVICRYEDSSNFYFFIISSDGYYGLGKVVDGEQTILGAEELMPSDAITLGNVTNTIRADCVGSTLTLYANGTQLASESDTTFTSGDVGLLAGTFNDPGTDIHFDNFVVRQP
ncbi:MAG TPA: hypothetical protein DEH25_13385 [Chloroflexi bacterium]|nr:hypothetical protein [Chloroflexota bacterium]HBY09026.1 hypothetical protein [Chloroflexota bacterium]